MAGRFSTQSCCALPRPSRYSSGLMAKKSASPLLRIFLRGVATLLPAALTIYLFVWLWQALDRWLISKTNEMLTIGVRWVVKLTQPSIEGAELATWESPFWVGAILSLALVFLLGWWLSGVLGRRIWAAFERFLSNLPLIGSVYPYTKQIVEFFFKEESKVEFERVVAVPYPRQGCYALSFLTSAGLKTLHDATGQAMVAVFVPTSPMPATGYTLFMPADEIIPLELSVDQAMQIIVSGGVIIPSEELTDVGLAALLQARSKALQAAADIKSGGAA